VVWACGEKNGGRAPGKGERSGGCRRSAAWQTEDDVGEEHGGDAEESRAECGGCARSLDVESNRRPSDLKKLRTKDVKIKKIKK
jgi:hypothetical protein